MPAELEVLHESLADITALGLDTVHPLVTGLQAKIRTETSRLGAATLSNLESGRPEEGPYPSLPSNDLLLYGMPITGVKPVRPLLETYQWAAHEYVSQDTPCPPAELQPPPSATPCSGFAHPQAPTFLRTEHMGHRRWEIFYSNFQVSSKPVLHQAPELKDGVYVAQPLPGMIQMPLSVPFVQRINGDPLNTVTCAVAHSGESLAIFGIRPQVEKLEKGLYIMAFGSKPRLGLKPNDRSAKNLDRNARTGSFSLSPTVGKGNGRGVFLPAVQTATPEASCLINGALKTIHALQQLIMPCSLSKFEYEMTKFHMTDNNVFIVGGLALGATSIQHNVFAGKKSLAEKIGLIQGSWHTDGGDAFIYWTFSILMLKLPPGSDPGPFMFGHCGLYVRETGVLILYLIFQGNDLHSGYAPTYDDQALKQWLDHDAIKALVDLVSPENRMFFVAYPTEVRVSHVAAVSVVPSVFFMNQGTPMSHKLKQKNFARHGAMVLGDRHAYANRLGREIWWGTFNVFKIAGLKLNITAEELFSKTTYENEEKSVCCLDPPPHDIEQEEDTACIRRNRGFFSWYKTQSEKYLIQISRDAYQIVQGLLLQRLAQQNSFPITERRGVRLELVASLDAPGFTITEVLRCDQTEGKASFFSVVAEDETPLTVSEVDAPWLHKPENAAQITQFLARNVPLNTPALCEFYQRLIQNTLLASSDMVGNVEANRSESPVLETGEPLFLPDSPSADQNLNENTEEGSANQDKEALQPDGVNGLDHDGDTNMQELSPAPGSELDDLGFESEEEVFEAPRLLKHQQMDHIDQWLVHGRGFDSTLNIWLTAEEIKRIDPDMSFDRTMAKPGRK
ncbi:hypothetical protein C8J57DRAFT_1533257 [Mycena rebaudengoi]|nr:hypothetical protein C8J57DRAFT_1533257 [Mycena rebaudengoi]